MFTVRELKELAQRLDAEAFEQQLGPFVLVERPFTRAREVAPKTTRPLTGGPPRRDVLDFDDLGVATLPPLRDEDEFLIGRTADCDVLLDEDTVSKHHARVTWARRRAQVEDLGSSNGTKVNGTRLRANTPLSLKDNDALDFGGVRVLFLTVSTLRKRMGLR